MARGGRLIGDRAIARQSSEYEALESEAAAYFGESALSLVAATLPTSPSFDAAAAWRLIVHDN